MTRKVHTWTHTRFPYCRCLIWAITVPLVRPCHFKVSIKYGQQSDAIFKLRLNRDTYYTEGTETEFIINGDFAIEVYNNVASNGLGELHNDDQGPDWWKNITKSTNERKQLLFIWTATIIAYNPVALEERQAVIEGLGDAADREGSLQIAVGIVGGNPPSVREEERQAAVEGVCPRWRKTRHCKSTWRTSRGCPRWTKTRRWKPSPLAVLDPSCRYQNKYLLRTCCLLLFNSRVLKYLA